MPSTLNKCLAVIGMGTVVVLSGGASADQTFTRNTQATSNSCFHVRDVEGYSPAKIGDHDGVNLRIKNQDVFQMEFVSACPDARTAARIRLQSKTVTDYVCSGADASLVTYAESGPTMECAISGLRKLDKDQVSALPENELP